MTLCDPRIANNQERPLQDLPEGVPALNSYYVYMTAGCNLACQHCWLTPTFQSNEGTGGHLDYDLFELAIEEGLPLGLSQVKLTGGEPLLHPDFEKIVKLIKEKGLGVNIETNGILLTKSLVRFLKEESSLSHISVSLDGAAPETHDPFRGVEGSFARAVQGIRHLVDADYHPQVIMSIHQGNIDEIEAIVHLAEEIGAGSVKFNLIQPSGRAEMMTERGQIIGIEQLIETGKWVESILQKHTSMSLHYSWPMAFYGLNRLNNKNLGNCSIFNILGILSTGHLAMCGIGVNLPELCYGILGEDRVEDIWISNSTLIDLRREVPHNLTGICGKCIFRDRCLGACIAENYYLSKQLDNSYWFCTEASEKNIFPSSRLRIPTAT
jgi:SynChlorMet cassette radical SAM/SPASM protein ScmF